MKCMCGEDTYACTCGEDTYAAAVGRGCARRRHNIGYRYIDILIFYIFLFIFFGHGPDNVVVKVIDCHARDWGSIPSIYFFSQWPEYTLVLICQNTFD